MNTRTRCTAGIVLLALIPLLVAVGCGPKSTKYDTPLSEASATPKLPAATRPAGPPVTAACVLLTAREVASALGLTAPSATEDETMAALPDVKSCRYQGDNGYLSIYVATEPVTGTADEAVNRALGKYDGTLEQLPGIGDAALIVMSGTIGTMVFAMAEADQMRTVTLIAFSSVGAVPKDGLVDLAHTLADRV